MRRWQVVSEPCGWRKFVVENRATGAVLEAKRRRGQFYANARRWKTREAAQKVADELNRQACPQCHGSGWIETNIMSCPECSPPITER